MTNDEDDEDVIEDLKSANDALKSANDAFKSEIDSLKNKLSSARYNTEYQRPTRWRTALMQPMSFYRGGGGGDRAKGRDEALALPGPLVALRVGPRRP